MDSTVIWIVIAIAVVVLVAAVAGAMAKKRSDERKRAEAAEFRREADQHAGTVGAARSEADEKAQRAELARLEAERAEREASEAHRGVQQEQAAQEDRLRTADRLDPDVDHSADEYAPGTATHTAEHGPTGTHTARDSRTVGDPAVPTDEDTETRREV